MSMKIITFLFLSIFAFACNDGKATGNANNIKSNSSGNNDAVKINNANTADNATAPKKELTTSTYEIVKSYKHDPNAFTQGLVFRNGLLYESTGERGRSSLRKVELESGKVIKSYKLADEV
jgi:glutaminyl-peptide cyclotransferase